VTPHQLQYLLVAGWAGRHRHLLNERPSRRGHDRRGVVCLWVSTPMTSSTTSASITMR
jgi:hypothetical protein